MARELPRWVRSIFILKGTRLPAIAMTYAMPSSRLDLKLRLSETRSNIYLARGFIEGLSYDGFRNNKLVFYATARCLQIISDLSRHMPAELKARHDEIPWTDIGEAGTIISAVTTDVQHRLVWAAIQEGFPPLLTAIEREIDTCS
jgi:uncharacterized protein with HEPN domain